MYSSYVIRKLLRNERGCHLRLRHSTVNSYVSADSDGERESAANGARANLHFVVLEPPRLHVPPLHPRGRTALEHNAEPRGGERRPVRDQLRRHRRQLPRGRPHPPHSRAAALLRAAALRVLHPQDLRTEDRDGRTHGTPPFSSVPFFFALLHVIEPLCLYAISNLGHCESTEQLEHFALYS